MCGYIVNERIHFKKWLGLITFCKQQGFLKIGISLKKQIMIDTFVKTNKFEGMIIIENNNTKDILRKVKFKVSLRVVICNYNQF